MYADWHSPKLLYLEQSGASAHHATIPTPYAMIRHDLTDHNYVFDRSWIDVVSCRWSLSVQGSAINLNLTCNINHGIMLTYIYYF